MKKIKLADIQPNRGQIEGLPKNPRKWDREDLDRLKRSIEETPELMEARGLIVAQHEGKYVVLGGNMRYAAVKALGWKDVSAHIIPQGTPVQTMKEIVLKDNGQFGSWDYDELANNWDDKPLNDWGVKAWVVPSTVNDAPVQEGDGATDGEGNQGGAGAGTLKAPERIIIIYPKDQEKVLAEILGLNEIDRIVYSVNELGGQEQ